MTVFPAFLNSHYLRRTLMSESRIACSIALLFWSGTALAQNSAPVDVHQIADTIVRLCIAGGSTQAVTGTATGGADISVRVLNGTGTLADEFRISKSNAEGLVSAINNALTQVTADQADKLRDCLKPVRDKLLDVLLPLPGEPTIDPPAPRPPRSR
jgi:hypothetical protein